MKNFLVFKVKSEPFNSDLLSGLLWDLNITGISEYDGFLAVNTREDSGLSLEIIEQHLEKIKKLNLIESYSVTEEYLKSKNWNEEWEKRANVIEVSDKFVIKPSFKNYNTPEKKIELVIDPKMSFGTGEHQTTKIMLQLLDGYMKKDDKVLDLGCGTGILGIAASKLGAGKIIAVDNDEWCYLNASENIKLNNILNMQIILGTINEVKDKDFNLVMANINRNVLIELKKDLFEIIHKTGRLIISGILDVDLAEIERQFTRVGFTAAEIKQYDEWLGVVFKKN